MTIQATNTTARPVALPGAKAPDQAPADDSPIAMAPEVRQRDSLKLSTEASIALAAKAQATPEAPVRKPLMNFPPYHAVIFPLKEQRAAVETALGGSVATFKGTGGATVDLSITQRPNAADGHAQFQVTVGTASIEVAVAPDLDANELLTRLVDVYSKVPEHLKPTLKRVVLQSAVNPLDAFWAKQFGSSKFAAGASAGQGVITFWKLQEQTHNLSQGTFNHELGHLIGETLSTSSTPFATHVPRGWVEAAKADDDRVSDYAGNNPDEDFADTWSYYVYARTDPAAMAAMRERFPHRIQILDAIFKNEFEHQPEHKPEKHSSRRSRARAV